MYLDAVIAVMTLKIESSTIGGVSTLVEVYDSFYSLCGVNVSRYTEMTPK